MNYDIVYQFTKKGNLLDYYHQRVDRMNISTAEQYDRLQEHYAQEREINLYAMVRYDTVPVSTRDGFIDKRIAYCKIKCPINPMPVKGEFELPSESSLITFLHINGWEYKQKIQLHMFE